MWGARLSPWFVEWTKGMFARLVSFHPHFKLLDNRQYCKASQERKPTVVVLPGPPCCEPLWTQVEQSLYKGSRIEIMSLKKQRTGGTKGKRIIHWKENGLTLKRFLGFRATYLCRSFSKPAPSTVKRGACKESETLILCTFRSTQNKPVIGALPICSLD